MTSGRLGMGVIGAGFMGALQPGCYLHAGTVTVRLSDVGAALLVRSGSVGADDQVLKILPVKVVQRVL